MMPCLCPSLPDLAHIPMGDHQERDVRFLDDTDPLREAGGAQWWLYLARCRSCRQHWLVAQEERIYDEHLLTRLTPVQADDILVTGEWPDVFRTYEAVLKIARQLSHPPSFFDRMALSLVATVEDLRCERPEIGEDEMAWLLGIDRPHVRQLLAKAAGQTRGG